MITRSPPATHKNRYLTSNQRPFLRNTSTSISCAGSPIIWWAVRVMNHPSRWTTPHREREWMANRWCVDDSFNPCNVPQWRQENDGIYFHGFPSRPLPGRYHLPPFVEVTSSNPIECPDMEPISANNRRLDHPTIVAEHWAGYWNVCLPAWTIFRDLGPFSNT